MSFGANGPTDQVKLKVIHLLRCSVKRVTFLFPKQMYKLKGWALVAQPLWLIYLFIQILNVLLHLNRVGQSTLDKHDLAELPDL